MALSPEDPHSYARPELASITHIHLELNVNFDRKVLQGKAVLFIDKEPSTNKIILDSYELVISSVKNSYTGSHLEYHIGPHNIFGSEFTIQLPQIVEDNNRCKIEIEYETSPDSPALYWLRPDQTADGTHPFLLSNNKYTYARAVFPCQDTPSVKFTYTANIVAPKNFSVLMSASLDDKLTEDGHNIYKFLQNIPLPSYAMIIAVGVLKYIQINSIIGVWTEHKYNNHLSKETFLIATKMLQKAKDLCGPYLWNSLDICVLPPSVSYFEIECPCLIFVSPILLDADFSLVSSIAQNISQNWTGILVTCANYEHLWLNKSFSMFISRKILQSLYDSYTVQFLVARSLDNFRNNLVITNVHNPDLLEYLLPNLVGLLPNVVTKNVPYERGYLFLMILENKIGDTLRFESFLKSYLITFACKSITTDVWKTYLYNYFPDSVLESIDWNFWFKESNTYPLELLSLENLVLERVCNKLVKMWLNCEENHIYFKNADIMYYCDLQKMYFLNCLHGADKILSEKKIQFMANVYNFDNDNAEIQFIWLRLCIKSRWIQKISAALDFSIRYCSPKFTYPIFQDLYEWSAVRATVIQKYLRESWKMLDEIQKEVAVILHINESVP